MPNPGINLILLLIFLLLPRVEHQVELPGLVLYGAFEEAILCGAPRRGFTRIKPSGLMRIPLVDSRVCSIMS
jgi:hypothetical protein